MLSGQAASVSAGGIVRLYSSAYPYPPAALVQTTVAQADGSFVFMVFPDRDTRYRVTVAGGGPSALVQVDVIGVALTKVKALSLGRARVTIVVFHPRDLRWGAARVTWWFASGYHRDFMRSPATHTVRLSPYVIVLESTVALPAGHFVGAPALMPRATTRLRIRGVRPAAPAVATTAADICPLGSRGPARSLAPSDI
jgi:hypothetical protein